MVITIFLKGVWRCNVRLIMSKSLTKRSILKKRKKARKRKIATVRKIIVMKFLIGRQ